ncbi:MAG: alpha/beta fold hydrolase [Velocimicrobium sp.]
MKAQKKWKKILMLFVCLFIFLGVTFNVYVSNYYHALDDTIPTISDGSTPLIASYDNYTIYGDSTKGTGFIFYQGGKVEEKAYEPLMYELSKEGICCVLVKMPYNLAVFDVNAASKIRKEISTIDNWYIGGHSLGGAMAASYTVKHADELKGLVLLGAYTTEKLPDDFPVLSLYGSEDGVLNREKYEAAKDNAKEWREIIIDGGNHAYFGNYGEQKGDGAAKIEPEEQWAITKSAILLWMIENEI